MDLFDTAGSTDEGTPAVSASAPLAVRMRPATLEEVAGQSHLLEPGSPLRRLVEPADAAAAKAAPGSVILWGPPGTGKTTIAYLVARTSGRRFVELSAVTAGVKDVREVVEAARRRLVTGGGETVLFIDEVHRFSKAQQDALLPSVENRWVTLVAATTENPSFSVNSPLLSRSLLLTLRALSDDDVRGLVTRAVEDERGLGGAVSVTAEALDQLVRLAGGDARKALTILEAAAGAAIAAPSLAGRAASADHPPLAGRAANADHPPLAGRVARDERIETTAVAERGFDAGPGGPTQPASAEDPPLAGRAASADDPPLAGRAARDERVETPVVDLAVVEQAIDVAAVRYDRDGDQHYDVVSAFIKSMRGSDVDAALHYLARMVVAGEDPRFIARRVVIAAAEDVGMADPSALQTAMAAAQAVAMIGMPEARIVLAEAVVHVATAPKSNKSYLALDAAIADVRKGRLGLVPAHLRDAHYSGARVLGHGVGYVYSHDEPNGVAAQQYLPDALVGTRYYSPTERGFERTVGERLERIREVLGRSRDEE